MLRYLAETLPRVLWELRPTPGARPLHLRTRHRVGLADIDLNRHMNQAAYARVCEHARVSWMLRTGALQGWRAIGVNPMVARQTLTYRRELAPFQRFCVETRAVGLEDRLLRLEQVLVVGDRVHARDDLALLFVGQGGVCSASDVAGLCDGLFTAPLPVEAWRVVD